MSSHRLERVRELLTRAISEAIRKEIPVEQAGIIAVNDVHIGSDLRQARVFVGLLGNSEQKKNALALLKKGRIRIQQLMAKEVILKYTPHLRFVVDDSVARGNHVLQIIEQMEKDQPAPAVLSPENEPETE